MNILSNKDKENSMEVYALMYYTEVGCERLIGIYQTIEGAIEYILNWYDYNVQDSREYGSQTDVEEAIKLRDKGRECYQDPENIQNFKQCREVFGHRFGLKLFELGK